MPKKLASLFKLTKKFLKELNEIEEEAIESNQERQKVNVAVNFKF